MAQVDNRPETVYQFRNLLKCQVTDGDTLKILADVGFGSRLKFTLQIWGVDAPETRTKDKVLKKAGERVAQTVELWIRAALKQGGTVVHSYAREYGEAVGDIHCPELGWLSEMLLTNGLALQARGSSTNKNWNATQLTAIYPSCEAIDLQLASLLV